MDVVAFWSPWGHSGERESGGKGAVSAVLWERHSSKVRWLKLCFTKKDLWPP